MRSVNLLYEGAPSPRPPAKRRGGFVLPGVGLLVAVMMLAVLSLGATARGMAVGSSGESAAVQAAPVVVAMAAVETNAPRTASTVVQAVATTWSSAPSPEAYRSAFPRPHPTSGLEPMELLALVPRAVTPVAATAPAAALAAPERVPTAAAHSVMEYILEQEKLRYPIPEDTGEGRRIIYSNRGQRVWLVEADGSLHDTYLISGRRGVPDPGNYRVYSKSEKAVAGHDGITMDWMVRFAWSDSGVRIGFHDIPKYADGSDMQTEDELGHYRSGGCVRQDLDHAIALYHWAPLGTPVIVIP